VYSVAASAAGRARAKADDVAAGAGAVRIVLVKGLEASGRVVDDKGAPVKGGRIFVQLSTDPSQSQSGTIDDAGNFTLTGLVDGTYDAMAVPLAGPRQSYSKCGTLKAGDVGVELRMGPSIEQTR
jgi:hypothetical protein